MCKPSTHFKFCTCNTEENIPEEYWKYYPESHLDSQKGRIGETIMPYLSHRNSTIEQLAARLYYDLNYTKIFDFEVDYQAGDCIETILKLNEIKYKLIFKCNDIKSWDLWSIDNAK